ncbi:MULTISPECIES: LexA family protein [Bacillota]|uniref:LexA family protein n=1 Tax=Bacillota TaxID=1239 RepID=UPI0031B5E4F6
MSTIGSRIRNRREELGLSQDELGKRLGYKSRSSINKIELDQRNLTQSKIKAIAEALETTPAYIMGWDEPDQKLDKENLKFFDNLFPIETKKFPLIGNIACGKPILADEQFEAYIEAGANIKADFCLRAKGDSMIGARIYDGDIVFIRKQEMVDDGEIAAVLIDDEATLKRVYYDQESNVIQLFAENPQYKTMRFAGEELDHIRILGKAVALQTDIK